MKNAIFVIIRLKIRLALSFTMLSIVFILTACIESGGPNEFREQDIIIGNFTGYDVAIEYPAGIDYATFNWENNEVIYNILELEAGQSEFITVAIFENDYDQLTIDIIENAMSYEAPLIWRECYRIHLYYDSENEELEYELTLY